MFFCLRINISENKFVEILFFYENLGKPSHVTEAVAIHT